MSDTKALVTKMLQLLERDGKCDCDPNLGNCEMCHTRQWAENWIANYELETETELDNECRFCGELVRFCQCGNRIPV